jgi:uncharacterized protein DUF5666
MKCPLMLIVGTLLVGLPSPSPAQDTRTANGKVTAVDSMSLTVRVADKDVVFAVDAKTDIVTPRGPQAKAAGGASPKLVELVQAGQLVQVKYHEAGMHAATIRVLPLMPAPSANRTLRATGVVSNLSPASFTMKGTAGEQAFVVDANTQVAGLGGARPGAPAKPAVTDVVKTGDTVMVTFHDIDGIRLASHVRVMRKARVAGNAPAKHPPTP